MPHVLLTGAGFTHNWGGWLANEIEGDLLTRFAANPSLRHRVQIADGFESVLQMLQQEAEGGDAEAQVLYAEMQKEVAASFHSMNLALAELINFNFSQDRRFSVNGYLAKFDAIYTLNQDLLLELHYDPTLENTRRWNGIYFPGVSGVPSRSLLKADRVDQKRKVSNTIDSAKNCQPIYKLHGSTDFVDESGDLFVVGGGKASFIERKPILKAYFANFAEVLRQPGCHLMIIGYGFADKHVNDVLVEACRENPSLGVFFVHPHGRKAVHRDGKRGAVLPQWTRPLEYLSCIGESTRLLSATFRGDELEFPKFLRFFEL